MKAGTVFRRIENFIAPKKTILSFWHFFLQKLFYSLETKKISARCRDLTYFVSVLFRQSVLKTQSL